MDAPAWMGKNGMGSVIRAKSRSLSFKLKCAGDGNLSINLKGEDIRDVENKRIPIWFNYTKITLDGKIIFDSVKPAWNNKPHNVLMDVKDGQVVDVQAEWLPDCVSLGS